MAINMIEKISRICWNDFGWTRPSGTNGKSPSSTTYENEKGFGHEEWLFDKSKIVNDYHYGFLQSLGSELHIDKSYKIWLYTVTRKQKLLVGYIDKAICIAKDESVKIYNTYKKNGWIKEMINDLEHAGIKATQFKEMSAEGFSNVEFLIKDIKIFDDFQIISSRDSNLTTPRYKLLDKVSDFEFEDIKQKGTDGYSRKAGVEILVDPYHNKIQNVLSKLLKSSRQYRNIKVEENCVDLQGLFSDAKLHFFEIKTDTLKNNIRQAIGQLFEYSMFPDKQLAEKIIIVGDTEPSREVKRYIKHLRDKTSINIFYRWIDMENEKLSNEI